MTQTIEQLDAEIAAAEARLAELRTKREDAQKSYGTWVTESLVGVHEVDGRKVIRIGTDSYLFVGMNEQSWGRERYVRHAREEIAAAIDKGREEAIAEEREACATIADTYGAGMTDKCVSCREGIAIAIRARTGKAGA